MSELMKREHGTDVATTERIRTAPTYVPRFDIVETEDELMLYGDLPGVAREDLDIQFDNSHLAIRGEVKPRHPDRESLRGEYGIGDYYREFQISEVIDAEKISGELNDGVLTVHLPKVEAAKPRRIEVKSG